MISFFQAEVNLRLNILTLTRSTRTCLPAALAARLAKDAGEEVGEWALTAEKIFQIFSRGILDVGILSGLGCPILPVEVLWLFAALLPALVLGAQFIVFFSLLRVR